jgi:hypothetical protein
MAGLGIGVVTVVWSRDTVDLVEVYGRFKQLAVCFAVALPWPCQLVPLSLPDSRSSVSDSLDPSAVTRIACCRAKKGKEIENGNTLKRLNP